jgi:hypothetical protein
MQPISYSTYLKPIPELYLFQQSENSMPCFVLKSRQKESLLQLPEPKDPAPLWPQNQNLLNLTYEERSLDDYDPDKTDLGTA